MYEGEWKKGNPHGEGRQHTPNGVFAGSFEDGDLIPDGEKDGLEERKGENSPNKTASKVIGYRGEKNEKGEKHGKGIMHYSNGDVYIGEWKNNKKDGIGVYSYASGDKYEGEYRYGIRHGQGSYYFKATNEQYTGQYEDGKMSGNGRFVYTNGSVYEGNFLGNARVTTLITARCAL